MKQFALGMIETLGYIGAIASADAAVKAASVTIDRMELVKGGIVTVFLTGDVGAVKAAVEAGENEARRVGNFRRSHVIARVADEVAVMLTPEKKAVIPPEANLVEPKSATPIEAPNEAPIEITEETPIEETIVIEEKPVQEIPVILPVVEAPKPTTTFKRSREELGRMKVVKLRNIARGIEGLGIDRSRIKFSNKEELITAILATYDRR